MTTNNTFTGNYQYRVLASGTVFLNSAITGILPVGTPVCPVSDTGMVYPHKRLTTAIDGFFHDYISAPSKNHNNLVYYDFPNPIHGYIGFLAVKNNIIKQH